MKNTTRRILLGIALGCVPAPARAAEAQFVVPGGATRFEDTSPVLTWTGAWSKNSLPANSGGSAMLAMDAGAQVSFVFTGVSARWIGYRDEWCGLAEVLVDGALQATVDTYATPARAQETLYAVNGLNEGRHTLTIRAKGTHGTKSGGSWVWVDAFAVGEETSPTSLTSVDPPRPRRPVSANQPLSTIPLEGPVTRGLHGESLSYFEQEDAAVSWAGPWSTNTLASHRGHSARLSMDAEARADFAFTGTGVSWIGYQDEWSGIAEVWLDGKRRATVDTYAKPARSRVELHVISGLPPGPHTLTIQPTGRRRQASGGAWVWVDGFTVAR